MNNLARFPGPETQEDLELSRINPDRYYFGYPLVKGLTPIRKISGAELLELAAQGRIHITDYQLLEMVTVASVTDMVRSIASPKARVAELKPLRKGEVG